MMELRDLSHGGAVIRMDNPIRMGEGAQGEVYALPPMTGMKGQYVVKLYRVGLASREGRHLVRLCEFINAYPQLKKEPLLTLPLAVVENMKEGRVGCIVRRAAGSELGKEVYRQLVMHPGGLQARLLVAQRAAEAIAKLHACGIVSADIAEENILVDTYSLMPFLIDLDGGGVLVGPVETTYQAGLTPLVRGHMEGSCLAPELLADAGRKPTLASDRWSLAVLVHKLLMGGLDPFFMLRAYREILLQPPPWPDGMCESRDLARFMIFQKGELTRLGAVLRNRLRAVFTPLVGGSNPARRPRADEWARDLGNAAEWVTRCGYCRQEFVAEALTACPFCNKPLPRAMVHLPQAKMAIDREGRSLLGIELGFCDGEGRYMVAAFGRRGGRLVMIAGVAMQERGLVGRYQPKEMIPLERDRPRRGFCAWSRDGRQQVDFDICLGSVARGSQISS